MEIEEKKYVNVLYLDPFESFKIVCSAQLTKVSCWWRIIHIGLKLRAQCHICNISTVFRVYHSTKFFYVFVCECFRYQIWLAYQKRSEPSARNKLQVIFRTAARIDVDTHRHINLGKIINRNSSTIFWVTSLNKLAVLQVKIERNLSLHFLKITLWQEYLLF